jgi:hypothetical protein
MADASMSLSDLEKKWGFAPPTSQPPLTNQTRTPIQQPNQTGMSLGDLEKKWGFTPTTNMAGSVPLQAQPQSPSASLAPLTAQALQGLNAAPQSVSLAPSLSFQEKHGRIGPDGERVPIDTDSGMDKSEYWRLAAQRDPDSQLAVLKKLYPDRNSRILDSGDVSLEVIDSKTGKPKDVMLNPSGVNAHDLIDLAVQAPEIGASIATAIATRGRGTLKTVAQMILSSVAGGATGAARDAGARAAEGIPIRPGEIAKTRGAETALDLFLQGAGSVAGKSTRIMSPFAKEIKPGTLEFDLNQARDFFKKNFGVDYPVTPGESTGSVALRAVEAAETPQPGARTVMNSLREKGDATVREIQKVSLGTVTPEEEIGKRGLQQLRNNIVEPLEKALDEAREQASKKGQNRIVSLLDDAVGATSSARVTPSMAGADTLKEFETKLAGAEAKVRAAYDKVNEIPGGTGDVLSGTPAARVAKEIRDELPTVQTTKETVQYDQYGNPMARQKPSTEILKSGVPDGLLKALDDLEGLRNGKVSLQTLTNMKKAAFDAIAAFKTAHGDSKDRWFTKIAMAYEQGIEKGIAETGDPALKQALTDAKETYKRELLPFERPGVKELAKGEFDSARLSPEQITDRLFEGPKAIENFRMLKQVLGSGNPVFRTLKRAWADTQLTKYTDPITGEINAKGLSDTLDKMVVERPELAAELFGKNYKELASALRYQRQFKNVKSVDDGEIKTLLSLRDPSRDDLANIIAMQKTRDKAYVNSMLKDIADGIQTESGIKPTEFLKRIRNTDTPSKDVELILSSMDKPTREAIATAKMYELLDAASVVESKTAVSGLMDGGALNISPKALASAMGRAGTPERARNELLLRSAPPAPGGYTREDVLENLVKLLLPREAKSDAFRSAGSIAGGAEVLRATRGPIQYAKNFVKKAILATAYTSELGHKLISNQKIGPAESAAFANILIASEPFIRRATDTFGPEMAKEIVADAKESINRFVSDLMAEQGQDSPQKREAAETAKFMRGEPAKMR